MQHLTSNLARVAGYVFDNKKALLTSSPAPRFVSFPDAVLAGAVASSNINVAQLPEGNAIISQILAAPEFQVIAPMPTKLDPMVIDPYGSLRTPPRKIINDLFSGAFLRMYLFCLPYEVTTYVNAVLEGFEYLRKAIKGEPIPIYRILGIAGMSISNQLTIKLPWGDLRSAPQVSGQADLIIQNNASQTACLLIQSPFVQVTFDRQPNPTLKPNRAFLLQQSRAEVLFPVACALASSDPSQPNSALPTWEMTMLPFQSFNGYAGPSTSRWSLRATNLDASIKAIEDWAGIVERNHITAVDLAARKLISAISQRNDPADALIDAVIAWENLVGTSQEVTFRVTGALAKIIVPEVSARKTRMRELKKVYAVRSKLVHGTSVNGKEITDACADAISVAIQALCFSYRRGAEWLSMSSEQRCDTVLLEWP